MSVSLVIPNKRHAPYPLEAITVESRMSRQNDTIEVRLAKNVAEVAQAQQLRAQIFGQEFGLSFPSGYDIEPLDAYCVHLLAWCDRRLIGTARLLDRSGAARSGQFYSEQAFDISQVLASVDTNIMELGRVCIHPDFRTIGTIMHLWTGVARQVRVWRVTHLMGCASIPLGPGNVQAWLEQLDPQQQLHLPISAYQPLPMSADTTLPRIPALLSAYLRMNARIGLVPRFDAEFQCADVFVWLPLADFSERYRQHFARILRSEKT